MMESLERERVPPLAATEGGAPFSLRVTGDLSTCVVFREGSIHEGV